MKRCLVMIFCMGCTVLFCMNKDEKNMLDQLMVKFCQACVEKNDHETFDFYKQFLDVIDVGAARRQISTNTKKYAELKNSIIESILRTAARKGYVLHCANKNN